MTDWTVGLGQSCKRSTGCCPSPLLPPRVESTQVWPGTGSCAADWIGPRTNGSTFLFGRSWVEPVGASSSPRGYNHEAVFLLCFFAPPGTVRAEVQWKRF